MICYRFLFKVLDHDKIGNLYQNAKSIHQFLHQRSHFMGEKSHMNYKHCTQ